MFYVDGTPHRQVDQSPGYPMQFMLGIYDFREPGGPPTGHYPKAFVVDRFRAYQRPGDLGI